jgi:hypothetical protein
MLGFEAGHGSDAEGRGEAELGSFPRVRQVSDAQVRDVLNRGLTQGLALPNDSAHYVKNAMRGVTLAGGGGLLRVSDNTARGTALTPRDVELIRYVARHGVCTPEQLTHRFFSGASACWRRLRALEGLGLLARQRTWWQGPRVLLATRLGTELAQADLPPARLNLAELEHALALVDLSEQLLTQNRGAFWITERELRRDAVRRQREAGMETRPTRLRTPDGLLVVGERRIAIELDLTNKRSEVYEQILKTYAGTPGIEGLWWFGRSQSMRERLAALGRRYQLADFLDVRPWAAPLHGPDLAVGM